MGAGFAVVGVITVSIAAVVLQAIDKSLLPGGRTDLTDPVNGGRVLGIVVVYLIACVGAPFFEELYFRGLVQGTLTARWGSAIGIVVQALLFGLVHLDPGNGWGNVGTFVIITIVGPGSARSGTSPSGCRPGCSPTPTYNAIIVTIAVWPSSAVEPQDAAGALGLNAGRWLLVGGDLVAALLGEPDVVEPVEQAVVGVVVELERLVEVERGHRDPPVHDVDRRSRATRRPRSRA